MNCCDVQPHNLISSIELSIQAVGGNFGRLEMGLVGILVESELYCSTVSPMLLSISSFGILFVLGSVTFWEIVVAARK